MKYVIFDNKYPVLFPDEILHCEVLINHFSDSHFDKLAKPTSAGHFNGKAFDRSETLNLESKEEDTEIIKNLLIKKYENNN